MLLSFRVVTQGHSMSSFRVVTQGHSMSFGYAVVMYFGKYLALIDIRIRAANIVITHF